MAVQHAGGWYGGGQCSNTVKGLLCTNSACERAHAAMRSPPRRLRALCAPLSAIAVTLTPPRPLAAASTPNSYFAIPGGGKFDVVHANWGLHDLVAACAPGEKGECEEHVDLESGAYGNNLDALYQAIEPYASESAFAQVARAAQHAQRAPAQERRARARSARTRARSPTSRWPTSPSRCPRARWRTCRRSSRRRRVR